MKTKIRNEKEIVEKDSIEKESIEKESVEKESTEKESIEKESMKKESMEKESTENESVEREGDSDNENMDTQIEADNLTRESTESNRTKTKDFSGKAGLPWSREELLETFGSSYLVKIVDLGNACWTYKHFTDDVQTRQYRAPEVILGAKYDMAIDVWSIACIVFELLTGDLLFEPKSGRTFEKDDDHLAQIQELLGRMPREVWSVGKNSRNFFNRRGELRKIKSLKMWTLLEVLCEKYKFSEADAQAATDFMLPMLHMSARQRATAQQMLEHPWIKNINMNDFNKLI